MNHDTYNDLTLEQKWSLVVAILVRDALEPFHLKGLLHEDQMPEFNRRVRRAILSATYCMMHLRKPGCHENVERLIDKIPDYWEIPGLVPEEHEYFDHGPTLAWSAKFPDEKHKIETWCKTGRLPDKNSLLVRDR